MTAEIISVGTELLLGNILNTNAQYLSRELAELGITVQRESTIGEIRGGWRTLSTRQRTAVTCWCSPAVWAPRQTT